MISQHFLGRLFNSVSVVCYFYLGKAGPTGYSSLSFSDTTHYLPFLSLKGTSWLLPVALTVVSGLGRRRLTLGSLGTKAPIPHPLGSPLSDNAVEHRSHVNGLPLLSLFCPYQSRLPPSTQHSPGESMASQNTNSSGLKHAEDTYQPRNFRQMMLPLCLSFTTC